MANLPYIVCGDVCVCQTNAALGYIGRKLGLAGKLADGKLKNEQLLSEIYDVRNNLVNIIYPMAPMGMCRTEEEFKEQAIKLSEKPPFKKFEAWLETYGSEYFSGDAPCTADFHIWEMLDQHSDLAKKYGVSNTFENLPKCKAFYDRFRALPTLQKYFASDDYKLPANSPANKAYHF